MPQAEKRSRVVIMGAAGRDFHNFNVVYRDDPAVEVVAFTAAQIPAIAGRVYPPALAGPLYPRGIPVVEEGALADLIRRERVDLVVFAYSDVAHAEVMHRASAALAAGADFALLGPRRTMLTVDRPVIAVSAVRTGCGKSQTTRWLSTLLKARGLKVAVIRHPMPYGDLERQRVQRFARVADLDDARCTVEEREEYEPHLRAGTVVFAGVDYAEIVARARTEAQVILWDGGNNDFPFVRPDLHIVLADTLRPGHESTFHPGEATMLMADVAVLAKANVASAAEVERLRAQVSRLNARAAIVRGGSRIQVADGAAIRGKRVLVVEDGPTLTHGGMPSGAGLQAALQAGAAAVVDPRPTAHPAIAAVFAAYPHLGPVLPALGYTADQLEQLRETIEATEADLVLAATPCDLGALIKVGKPVLRVGYDYVDLDTPGLAGRVADFLTAWGL